MNSINENKGFIEGSDSNYDTPTEFVDTRTFSISEETTNSFDLKKFEEENSDHEIVMGVSVLEELQIRGIQHLNQTGQMPESIYLTVVLKNILYTNYHFYEEMEKLKKIPEGLTPVFVMGNLKLNSNDHKKIHVYFLDEGDYKVWRSNNLSLGVVVKEIQPKRRKMVGI